jgi:hypothetical protein
MHYSGKIGSGTRPIDELLWSNLPEKERNRKLLWALSRQALGLQAMDRQAGRVRRKIEQLTKNAK